MRRPSRPLLWFGLSVLVGGIGGCQSYEELRVQKPTAKAGCAYVLWEEKTFLASAETQVSSHKQTDILGSAYASLNDCDATLQRLIADDLARGNTLANPQVLEWRSKDGKLTIITSYRCLPETMNLKP
ncbi:MAG: hypothetical protein CV089_20235 [Nitrospira sp. WS110]|nr:hypothetical protein [Nitrospira sp. WS110]